VKKAITSLLVISGLLSVPAGSLAEGSVTPSCMARPLQADEVVDLSDKVRISADSGEVQIKKQLVIFDGDVEIVKGPQKLRADEVRYDAKSKTASATGNVVMQQPGFEVSSPQASFDLAGEEARLDRVRYKITEHGGQGNASSATLRRTGVSVFNNISYSTCPPQKEDWSLHAKRIEIDRDKGVGTATSTSVKFKRATLFTVPRFHFPLTDKRVSGFLVPKFGYSSATGVDIITPYYINMAPNYDATLYPRFTSRRGMAFGGEFRYLTEAHEGKFFGEIFPNDPESTTGDKTRYAIGYDHKSRFNSHLKAVINFDYLSDKNYLEDFSSRLDISSSRYAVQLAELRYDEKYWQSWLRVQNLQTIDEKTAAAYRLMPQLGTQWYRQYENGLITAFDAELTNFERKNSVTGTRLDIRPAAGYGTKRPWGHIKTMLSGRHTSFNLNNVAPGNPTDLTRNLYTVSFDAGLFFERRIDWFGKSGYQTLEPRLFYLYTPYKNQDAIPEFDTKLVDFSFANLFRENRFTGADRVGDANQLVIAVSSRFIRDGSQKEWFRASIGQIVYFDDRRVQLTNPATGLPYLPETGSYGAFVAEIYTQIDELWSAESAVQWNHDKDRLDKGLVRISYHNSDADKFLSLAWKRDLTQSAEYTDLSFRFPVNDKLKAIGRWQYSIVNDVTLDFLGGLEYDTCCWSVRGVAQRHRDDSGNSYDTNFYFQLVLKGLGGLGKSDMNSFLSRNVYGYDGFEYF
jgi:LPS-assembly protein